MRCPALTPIIDFDDKWIAATQRVPIQTFHTDLMAEQRRQQEPMTAGNGRAGLRHNAC
jgi:hypothetical protein